MADDLLDQISNHVGGGTPAAPPAAPASSGDPLMDAIGSHIGGAPDAPKYSGAGDYAAKALGGSRDAILENLKAIPGGIWNSIFHPMNTASAFFWNNPAQKSLRDQAEQERNLAAQNKEGFFSDNNLNSAAHSIEGTIPIAGPLMSRFLDLGDHPEDLKDPNKIGRLIGDAASLKIVPKVIEEAAPLITMAGKDTIGAAMDAAKKIPNLPEKISGKASQASADLATQALRPRISDFGFDRSAQTALPDIKEAIGGNLNSATHKGNFDAFMDGVDKAMDLNRKRYAAENPNGAVIQAPTDSVADSMLKALKHGDSERVSEQTPAIAEDIQRRADSYRNRSMTLDEITARKQQAQADLEEYYNQNPAAKRSDLIGNPKLAASYLEAEALKNLHDSTIDSRWGNSNIADLQRRYGALKDIKDAALRRENVLNRQPDSNLPQTLSKMELAKSAGTALASGVGGIGLFHSPEAGGLAAGAALVGDVGRKLMADYIRNSNDTHGLLRQAIKNTNPSTYTPPSAPFQPAGLLPPATTHFAGSVPPPTSGPNLAANLQTQINHATHNIGARALPPAPRVFAGTGDVATPAPDVSGANPEAALHQQINWASADTGRKALPAASAFRNVNDSWDRLQNEIDYPDQYAKHFSKNGIDVQAVNALRNQFPDLSRSETSEVAKRLSSIHWDDAWDDDALAKKTYGKDLMQKKAEEELAAKSVAGRAASTAGASILDNLRAKNVPKINPNRFGSKPAARAGGQVLQQLLRNKPNQ